MKIFHAAETIKGGVATVMRQLIENQIATNKNVICLIPDKQKQELKSIDNKHFVLFKRKGRTLSSFISFIYNFSKIILRDKPDIVHLHSTFAGVMGRIIIIFLKPIWRPKLIYCPHAFSFLMQSSSKKRSVYSFTERFLSKYTDVIICVSKYEKQKAIEVGIKESKLQVVYNGVAERNIISNPPNPFSEGVFNVLFVGRFDFQKGFDILFEVMHALAGRPFHLTAVGGTVHDDKFELVDMPQTTFTGWLDSESLAPYFIHADALVMPSRWEGFGLVASEAMSYGLPVLATNCTSLPEIVQNNKTGYLFSMGNVQEIVNILTKTKKDEWNSMRFESKKVFLENFTTEKMIAKTSNIYVELLSSKDND